MDNKQTAADALLAEMQKQTSHLRTIRSIATFAAVILGIVCVMVVLLLVIAGWSTIPAAHRGMVLGVFLLAVFIGGTIMAAIFGHRN